MGVLPIKRTVIVYVVKFYYTGCIKKVIEIFMCSRAFII